MKAPPTAQQTPGKPAMTALSGSPATGFEGTIPTLRVMRLYPRKIWVEATDERCGHFRSTSTLVVPEAFGKIYKGQKFCAYVSITNTTEIELRDVQISVKLHAPSSKRGVELGDVFSEDNRAQIVEIPERWTEDEASYKRPERRVSNPASLLAPGEHVDVVVEHRVAEAGTHTMRVSVAYADGGSVRKFYRFAVAEPVGISTRAVPVQREYRRRGEPRAYVEATLENKTHEPCVFDNVVLHAPPGSTSKQLSPPPTIVVDEDVVDYDPAAAANPGDSRTALFALFGDDDQDDEDAARLEIGWTSSTGESGSVSTSRIELSSQQRSDAPVTTTAASDLPRNVSVGRRFECECLVTNRTDRELRLQLQWRVEDMPRGIKIFGVAHKNLGALAPASSKSVSVNLRAAEPGFHALTGVRVVDLDSQRELHMPVLGHVLVTSGKLPPDLLSTSRPRPPPEKEAAAAAVSRPPPPHTPSSLRIPVNDDPLAFVV